MFSYSGWNLGNSEILAQKLCIYEMGENVMIVIDPAILLKPVHASCGKWKYSPLFKAVYQEFILVP
jgi:hypothetical protein